ncbi:hypothetical protein B0H17DRAFT_1203108 [Mycena rosella]|uniref:Uncharacterized protein n=1 Tax=Mycena rosella TaxID=1033263 RepID=A0AAD7DEC1_MYCRO|nr:hypothetical protein B0H17DRAFT_1203108 [Mycena rosella]
MSTVFRLRGHVMISVMDLGLWSHVWDGLLMPTIAPQKKWKHEDGSKMMFRSLLETNNINLPEKDVRLILALIDGEPSQCSPDEKSFLFDIVANKRNGLDVDKFDYIARDSYITGEPSKISLTRLINSARVIDDEIYYDIKDTGTSVSRSWIIEPKAIEYMIVDALILAEPFMKIADRTEIPDEFLHLTDCIMRQIESTRDPDLAPARAIFRRIRVRDLYKFVDSGVEWERRNVFRERITRERIVEEARKLAAQARTDIDLTELTPDSVIVDHALLHYGMKDKNPLVFVRFYSKRNFNKASRVQKGDYLMLMPPTFAVVTLYLGLVQAGYRAVRKTIPDALTTTIEPLSTPTRGHSRNPTSSSIAENSFTTVPLNYAPTTPGRRRETVKRALEEGGSVGSLEEDERQPKRRAK